MKINPALRSMLKKLAPVAAAIPVKAKISTALYENKNNRHRVIDNFSRKKLPISTHDSGKR